MPITNFRAISAAVAALAVLSACDSSNSTEPTAAPKPTTLTACDWDQMELLDVKTLSHADAVTVCQTIQNSLGHVPSLRIAKELATAMSAMQMKGDKTPISDQAYQYMNIVEARGQTDSDDAMYDTFNVVFKVFNGSMGHVMPRDLNMALRAMAPQQARKINDDGIYTLGAVIQEEKKANGE
ncbi:hypothetical protein B0G80_0253 [Paraburkholderia sp. BL6669N2]|uniref:hypothetical protein n=1 Tax=Paraburkholderia sp. BL6669N2 TaxID=1938807 RepID=UPI000E37F4DF|nr:hypothetical protein [Paraburkholderia sp. BL6669N2]REG57629.1 hypothetical protein B0G80_0253 [Paraburkholderia sp. BL6669N2]